MIVQSSLQYKMLRLVAIQAIFFVAVLTTLWVINPRWVVWHQEPDPIVSQSLYEFKFHYGLLSTLNLKLAQQRNLVALSSSELSSSSRSKSTESGSGIKTDTEKETETKTTTELTEISKQLHDHIQAIKSASIIAQQHFNLDFTVLVQFLFNYKSKVAQLEPNSPEFQAALWDAMIYFSRIQSEFFFIVEEIDRHDTALAKSQLQNAQSSLMIWVITSFGSLLLGTIIALNYTRIWRKQISQLLAQVYRVSADDYSARSKIHSDDELGFLANAFNEAIERIRKKH